MDLDPDRGAVRTFAQLLAEGVVVCDGAMGTMLHAAGVPMNRSLAELNVSRPELVRDLHAAYAAAGAHVLQTNTFDANRLRLAGYGLEEQVAEVNIAGARLAREAAQRAERAVLVAGSVGPATGISAAAHGVSRMPARARADALREQIAVLADWVDLLVLETFGDLESMLAAIEVAGEESDLPVIAQMTFGDDGRTLRGEPPAEVAAVLGPLQLAAVGANCTVGPAALQPVVAELARWCRLPISVQPNAGVPQRLRSGQIRYARNAAYFGRAAAEFVAGGASIVGGCCGTAPAHIRAISTAVAGASPPRVAGATGPVPIDVRRPAGTGAAQGRPQLTVVAPAAPSASQPGRWPPDGELVVAAGLVAPRGQAVPEFLAQAEQLRAAGADLMAITDPPPPWPRVNPIGAAVVLKERVGADVLIPVETADRNLATLQADLLGAHALGLRIVACRTGAPRVAGDYPQIGGPWEVDSVRLIAAMRGLNDGVDWRGVATPEPTGFSVGGSINTATVDVVRELARAQEKVSAGAHFLVTDVVYDLDGAMTLLAALRGAGCQLPVIASLAPFSDVRTLEWLSNEVPGVSIPPAAITAARLARSRPQRAVEVAVGQVEKLLEFVSGVIVHLPTPSPETGEELVARIVALRTGPVAGGDES